MDGWMDVHEPGKTEKPERGTKPLSVGLLFKKD